MQIMKTHKQDMVVSKESLDKLVKLEIFKYLTSIKMNNNLFSIAYQLSFFTMNVPSLFFNLISYNNLVIYFFSSHFFVFHI
jgi:hypothetical protein